MSVCLGVLLHDIYIPCSVVAAPAPIAVFAATPAPVPSALYNPAPTPAQHTEVRSGPTSVIAWQLMVSFLQRLQTKATIPIIAHPAAQIKTQSFKCKELTGTKQIGFLGAITMLARFSTYSI